MGRTSWDAASDPLVAWKNQRPDPMSCTVHAALNSSGRPIDHVTLSSLESRFQRDFSNVRIHTDSQAAASAQRLNARAYTVGDDIVFAEDAYAPGSSQGQALLVHELTHVLQQKASGASIPSALHVDAADSASEREAHANAAQAPFATSLHVQQTGHSAGRVSLLPEDPTRPRAGGATDFMQDMQTTEQGLYDDYQHDCKDQVRFLERIDMSSLEAVKGFEKRLRVLPTLFAALKTINAEPDLATREIKRAEYHLLNVEGDFPKFPKGYSLGTEAMELGRTRCQLAEARWLHFSSQMGGLAPLGPRERRLIRR